ncbi:MAG TPA: PLP-dependent aminotransferase family protein, partial [Acidobacteriota bacterium]|nr:PLP-dependent aminotransferase family protein [Acidobacteriota bacterium]
MQTQTHLYEQVAGKIERLIEDGVLRPGERVPSVRKVSQMHRVSMATAFQAYFLLENKGLIESRPRSGFYVRMLSKGLPPTPNRTSPAAVATSVNVDDLVGSILAAMRRPDLVQLGAASPSSDLLPVNRLNRTLMDVVRRSPKRTIEYELIAGNAELRRQIALRSLTWGGNLSADDIVVTNGCIEALNLCLRAVARAGDTIAIESPTYYGVLQVIENLGMRALEIPTSPTDGICLDALETALHSQSIAACLVMSNFNNPLGSCMPDAKKQRLVEILASHTVPLIEDDIYGDLNFGTTRPKTCKAFDRDGLVLLCASFSKTLAPGYRIGWTAPG